MTELLTAAQMRAVEQAAIDSGQVTGLELMERAGQGVVDAVFAEWPALAEGVHRAIVLCGPGNNGGDGFVVARLLAAAGWSVAVYLWGDAGKLPPDARVNHDKWCGMGEVKTLNPSEVFAGDRPDLIVDAVFGIGLTRPLPGDVALALDTKGREVWKRTYDIKVVAVDCPSGLDLDRGMLPGDADPEDEDFDPWPQTMNVADLAVTFHAPKVGHYLGIGPTVCRKVSVVDIGLGSVHPEQGLLGMVPEAGQVRLVDPVYLRRPLPRSLWPASYMGKPKAAGHKYDHGHAVVFAGGVGRGGAARLAARAALRAGAGLVTVLCPPAALIENASHLNAVMLRSLAKDQPLQEVVDARASSFCLGPGMGIGAQTRARVVEVLARRAGDADWRDPVVVLDADALTSFEAAPEELFACTHARTILTPHEGEFARLFPDLSNAARRGLSKVDAVCEAAARAGCIILLKGPDTVIAGPQGGASVHAAAYGREVPWLATAGAGDVLAGLIAGLAASQASGDLHAIAEIAAYLHVEAARAFGPGLIAEDLPEQLPAVFRDLGL